MNQATPEKPQKDTFANFEREQQLKAQILARKNVDKANFLNKFDDNKAKNMLTRALAPRLPSINPQQNNSSAISHSPASNHRSVSTDPRLQQQHRMPKELTDQLTKHQDMKEMQHFINKNVLKDVGIVSPLEVYKAKKVENLQKRREKLFPQEEESSIKQLTYMQIREFYYAELLDTEFNPAENPLEKKKKEIKQMLIQIGKRKSEKERYRILMNHPKTVQKEKLVLQGKIHANDIAIENLKQKLRETLSQAPLNLRDIEREMLADPQERANQEFLQLAESEIKNLDSDQNSAGNAQGSSFSRKNTGRTRQNSAGTNQNSAPSQERTKTLTNPTDKKSNQYGSHNTTYYSDEQSQTQSLHNSQQSYHTQNGPSNQANTKEIKQGGNKQQTPSNRSNKNQLPPNNTYTGQSGPNTPQHITQSIPLKNPNPKNLAPQTIQPKGPKRQHSIQSDYYSDPHAHSDNFQSEENSEYHPNGHPQYLGGATEQEHDDESEYNRDSNHYNSQANYQPAGIQQQPQIINQNPKGNQNISPPQNIQNSKVQNNIPTNNAANGQGYTYTDDENMSYMTENDGEQHQAPMQSNKNQMYPNQPANYKGVEETKDSLGRPQTMYGAQQQPQKLPLQQQQNLPLQQPQKQQSQQPQNQSPQQPQNQSLQQPQKLPLQQPQNLSSQQPQNLSLQQPQNQSPQQPQNLSLQQPQKLPLQQPQNLSSQQPQNLPLQQTQKLPLQQPQKLPLQQPQILPLQQPQNLPLQPQKLPLQQPKNLSSQQPQMLPLQQPQKLPLQQNGYNNSPYQQGMNPQQQPFAGGANQGGKLGQNMPTGQKPDQMNNSENFSNQYTYEEDESMEIQGPIQGQASQNRNMQGAVRQPAASARVKRNEAGQPPKPSQITKPNGANPNQKNVAAKGSHPSIYEDFEEESQQPSDENITSQNTKQAEEAKNNLQNKLPNQQPNNLQQNQPIYQNQQMYQKQPSQIPQMTNQQASQMYQQQQQPMSQVTNQQAPQMSQQQQQPVPQMTNQQAPQIYQKQPTQMPQMTNQQAPQMNQNQQQPVSQMTNQQAPQMNQQQQQPVPQMTNQQAPQMYQKQPTQMPQMTNQQAPQMNQQQKQQPMSQMTNQQAPQMNQQQKQQPMSQMTNQQAPQMNQQQQQPMPQMTNQQAPQMNQQQKQQPMSQMTNQQESQMNQKQQQPMSQMTNQQAPHWYQNQPQQMPQAPQLSQKQDTYDHEHEMSQSEQPSDQFEPHEYHQQQSISKNPNNPLDSSINQHPYSSEPISDDHYPQSSGMNDDNNQESHPGDQTGLSNNQNLTQNQTGSIQHQNQTQNQTGLINKQLDSPDPNKPKAVIDPNKSQPVIQHLKTIAMSMDSNITANSGNTSKIGSAFKTPPNQENEPDLTKIFDPELAKAMRRIKIQADARAPTKRLTIIDKNAVDEQEKSPDADDDEHHEENSQAVNNDSQFFSNKSDFLKGDTRIFDNMKSHSNPNSVQHQSKSLNPLLDPTEYKYGAYLGHSLADSRDTRFNKPTIYPPAENEIKLNVGLDLLPAAKQRKQDPDDPEVRKLKELNNELHAQRKSNQEKARMARKFLSLTQIDIRALKNRLGVSTLFEYIDSLRRYQADGKEDEFSKLIEESLCSRPRAQYFIDILKSILDLEDKYYEEQKKMSIKVVERKFIDIDGKPEKHKETHDHNSQIIYMFLPFWYTKLNDKTDSRVNALLNQFEINQFIAAKLVSTMKLSTIEEFVLFYRNNRGSKEFGIFHENEISSFMDAGWKRADIEEFSRTIILLAKEALMTPKFLFEFPRIPKTYDVLNISNVKGLSMGALSSIVTCLVTRENSLKKVLISNIDLQPDATLLFELLFSTPTLNIIEIDVSMNPIKDAGFENILMSFKANKINYLRILRVGGTSLSIQGGIRILSFIRETKFTYSYINLKVLSMENNQIGNMGLETLASSLVKNKTLTYLDLSFNSIQDGGLTALCNLLKYNSALKVLYLHGNKFSNEYVCKLFADISSASHDAGLVVLKLGDLQAHVDNILKLISDGLIKLRNLRYVEIVSSTTTQERYEKAQKSISDMDHLYFVVRFMINNQSRYTKGLIDLISLHTYEETLKEIDYRKANPTAPMDHEDHSNGAMVGSNTRLDNQSRGKADAITVNSNDQNNTKTLPEPLEKHIQEIVTDYYKQHTLEVTCYCLQELIPYNTELKEGDTFLHRLVEFGQVEAAVHALNLGIDLEITTAISHKGFPHATLLHVAVANGSIPLVNAFLGEGAKADAKDVNENTPLHYAASTGHLEISELLIGKGAPLTAKNKKLMEPLYAAILSDDVKVWDYFKKKMDPQSKHDTVKEIIDKRLFRGVTPLMIAIEHNCANMFNYFLRLGTNVNILDEEGRNAVHWAAEKDRVDFITKLLNFGPKLNVKDSKGETPIVHVVRHGRLDIAQKMFEKDARLDIVTNKGDTLMHIAAKLNRGDIVQWLLDHGLSSNATNIFNQKPSDLATDKRVKAMVPDDGITVMQFDPYDYNPYDYSTEKNSQSNHTGNNTGNSQSGKGPGTSGEGLPTRSQKGPTQGTLPSQRDPNQMNQTYQSKMNQSGYNLPPDQSPLKGRALTPSKQANNRSFDAQMNKGDARMSDDNVSYHESQDPSQMNRSNGLGNTQQSYNSYSGNQNAKGVQLPSIGKVQSNLPNQRNQGPGNQNIQPSPQTLESIINKNQQNGQKWHQSYDANQRGPQNPGKQKLEEDEAFDDFDEEDPSGESNNLTKSSENKMKLNGPPKLKEQSKINPANKANDKQPLKRTATPAEEYDDSQGDGSEDRVSNIPQNGAKNKK